jgi:hypothetical protein
MTVTTEKAVGADIRPFHVQGLSGTEPPRRIHRTRRDLAGVVRGVHGGRPGQDGAADMI